MTAQLMRIACNQFCAVSRPLARSSQIFASVPSVPRGFKLQKFWPAFGRAIGGPWEEGGPSQTPPLSSDPPFPPF